MKKPIIININTLCKTHLTQIAINHLKKIDAVSLKTSDFNFNTNELRCPLWQFMQYFGEKLYMGSHPLTINNEIELEIEN